MWTLFWDMHSGGGCKESPYELIFIEAPEKEAELVFFNRFGHNPHRVSCTCCGADYSISEEPTLEESADYHYRGDTLENFKKRKDVLIIYASEIKGSERTGGLPVQGFVWN